MRGHGNQGLSSKTLGQIYKKRKSLVKTRIVLRCQDEDLHHLSKISPLASFIKIIIFIEYSDEYNIHELTVENNYQTRKLMSRNQANLFRFEALLHLSIRTFLST